MSNNTNEKYTVLSEKIVTGLIPYARNISEKIYYDLNNVNYNDIELETDSNLSNILFNRKIDTLFDENSITTLKLHLLVLSYVIIDILLFDNIGPDERTVFCEDYLSAFIYFKKSVTEGYFSQKDKSIIGMDKDEDEMASIKFSRSLISQFHGDVETYSNALNLTNHFYVFGYDCPATIFAKKLIGYDYNNLTNVEPEYRIPLYYKYLSICENHVVDLYNYVNNLISCTLDN